ncbi:MAG TPA: helicase C-terminal domain-containing protein [Chthonomonadales bacterium]|nr:helicase C-terminal domain-containing protein [Chthonomonadales bacterium]
MTGRRQLPDLARLLSPGGRLARALPGFEFRQEQLDAAEAVHDALAAGQHCLLEAGTGVGKSLAYLLPIALRIAEGSRCVVSTHTIGLQTQLIEKDIPLVQRLLPEIEVRPVLMKGRGNYLCKLALDNAHQNLLHASSPDFRFITGWATETETGDVAELPFAYPAWRELAAEGDICRAQECSYFGACFYYAMRRRAREANLIVANHALAMTDLALRRALPDKCVIPDHDAIVFDEAHHLEDVATRVLGVEMDSRALPHFADRLRRQRSLDLTVERLDAIVEGSERLFGQFAGARPEFLVGEALDQEACAALAQEGASLCALLDGLQQELRDRSATLQDEQKQHTEGLAQAAASLRGELHALLFAEEPDHIRWGAVDPGGESRRTRGRGGRVTLAYTPVHVGRLLTETLWSTGATVVLTSATLSNSGGFSYIRSRLAAPESAREALIGSPFDFREQAMLYVPRHLPPPPREQSAEYAEAVAAEIERVVQLTQGRAFLLFTSRRMMLLVYDLLKGRLPFPLFRQGDSPPGRLLDEFRESGQGCLFGLQSFWEGVDVRGEALSCVVIDRLPFAVPDSPITRARTAAIAEEGGDWFREFSIPQAQMRLKQGFGRLIRTRTDRGIVCILDTRMLTRSYGEEFVRHLPPAARASLWPRVERFWRERCGGASGAAEDGIATGQEAEGARGGDT